MVRPFRSNRSLDQVAQLSCRAGSFVEINALQPDELGVWVIKVV